jgi:dTDP-4-dehydrorhamnose 3,5-epimerase-like enzyme
MSLIPLRRFSTKLNVSEKGELVAINFEDYIPFLPKRIFFITKVPHGVSRGSHAHKKCIQVLNCPHGIIDISIDDGVEVSQIRLMRPEDFVYVPPFHWLEIKFSSDNDVLAVFASDEYDPEDYLNSYSEFKESLRDE